MGSARPDFLVVGAQKAGTTSLFRYLSSHPDIYMPPEKEVNYWSDPAAVRLGIDWYLSEYFSKARNRQIWGEASVQYMCIPEVAARIREARPSTKILAILRNPIDRALSHYRMLHRRGLLSTSFEDAVSESLSLSLDPPFDENRDFVALGLYSLQLRPFFEEFAQQQIRVLFLEELAADSKATMRQVFEFVGVAVEFQVPMLDKSFNVGGESRVQNLTGQTWYRFTRRLARILLPPQTRRAVGFWLETEWNVRRLSPPTIALETRGLLANLYKSDIKELESLMGRKTPWSLA